MKLIYASYIFTWDGFPSSHVWMWELVHKESWPLKNWSFQMVMLEKTLESPLGSEEIKPVNPKGNQTWILIGRTDVDAEAPILWPPDMNSWLTGKDPDGGKDWRQKEKGAAEDEMVGWHHQLNGREFVQTPGKPGVRQSMRSWRVGHNLATEQQGNDLFSCPLI